MKEENQQDFRTIRGYQLSQPMENEMTPAMEDYLEMIYRLCEADGYTRIGILSKQLHVQPSSASKMAARLKNAGFLTLDRYSSIILTAKGSRIAEYLMYRHQTLERFLTFLGEDETLQETELLEHSVTSETVERLNTLMKFFEQNPAILEKYRAYARR